MASCININSVEYQTLKKKSGLSDFELLAQCRPFLDKYDRFPYVDELAESNSEPDLKESLEMTDTSANIDQILRATGTKSIKEKLLSVWLLIKKVMLLSRKSALLNICMLDSEHLKLKPMPWNSSRALVVH